MITHLSFTRIKELLISPEALYRYMNRQKEQTAAMIEGSLVDCLVFEPERFDERFHVLPDGFRRPTAAQINAKNPSPETIELIEMWEGIEKSGKTIVKPDQVSEAKRLSECIINNSTIVYNGLLNDFQYQIPVEFYYKGIKHKGVKDADGVCRNGHRTIWDLKRMGNSRGEQQVARQIRAMSYDLQAAIYCHEFDKDNTPVNYYIIAIDNDGNVTPFEITKQSRMAAYTTWNKAIQATHRLIMEDNFFQSTEFWADGNGFFKY